MTWAMTYNEACTEKLPRLQILAEELDELCELAGDRGTKEQAERAGEMRDLVWRLLELAERDGTADPLVRDQIRRVYRTRPGRLEVVR